MVRTESPNSVLFFDGCSPGAASAMLTRFSRRVFPEPLTHATRRLGLRAHVAAATFGIHHANVVGEHEELSVLRQLAERPQSIVGHRQIAGFEGPPCVRRDPAGPRARRDPLHVARLRGDHRALNGWRVTGPQCRGEQILREPPVRCVVCWQELPLLGEQAPDARRERLPETPRLFRREPLERAHRTVDGCRGCPATDRSTQTQVDAEEC